MGDVFLLLVIAYFIGSLSPGYFFGKVIRGIDIREQKNRNTGAANTYYLVGPFYGVVTGIFDALKAVVVYFIAVRGLSFVGVGPINLDLAILVGLMAVVGHIWPFYLRFRGGRGAASLAGLGVIVVLHTSSWYSLAFIVGAIIYGIILNEVKFEAPVRKVLKLVGVMLPLSLLFVPVSTILSVLLVLLFVAATFDIVRFLAPRLNTKYLSIGALSKRKEQKFFSGYTLFIFSAFIVLRYFSSEIAIFTMVAFIFGDLLAPIGKDVFLPVGFIKEKTLGGVLIIFTVAVLVGVFLRSLALLPLSINMILAGALTAAILDQLSFAIDDNILVPIGTALILTMLI